MHGNYTASDVLNSFIRDIGDADKITYCQLLPTIWLFTHTGHVVGVADSLAEETVPDLPGEDAGTLPLVVGDLVHHARGRHARLRTADGTRLDRARLVIPTGDE